MQGLGVDDPVALEQAFRAFDFDGSGEITAKEWLLGTTLTSYEFYTHPVVNTTFQ